VDGRSGLAAAMLEIGRHHLDAAAQSERARGLLVEKRRIGQAGNAGVASDDGLTEFEARKRLARGIVTARRRRFAGLVSGLYRRE
jgi:hypothetical protein